MRNGYALATAQGLEAIARLLPRLPDADRNELQGELAIGVHSDVQVTDVTDKRVRVSQAFCSALPVGYSRLQPVLWEPFARLVLEAAYEATLLAAVEQAARGESNVVLLTRVGGGAFGNHQDWIDAAIQRALGLVEHADLDVRIVCYGGLDAATHRLLEHWAR